jgi:HAD superfamily hydrolase (TIGR01509 family)
MAVYLFDFDGTLVDSMPTYGAMMIQILEDDGVPYPPDVLKIITPLGFTLTARYFAEVLGHPRPEAELLEKMYTIAKEAYANRIPAKSAVVETLRALKARGDRLNVLTASPHQNLDVCLQRLGIFDLFDHVWSCEDFALGKSDPEIYRAAAKRLGVDVGDVTFLDDNYNADKTAKEAGMRVIGVYDDSSAEYEAQIRAVCDGYICNFKELL